MAKAFCGKWKCTETKNFCEYMTAIGAPPEIIKVGSSTDPLTIFSLDGDRIVVKIEHGPPTHNNVDISFKLGEEFIENTSDGRKCISCATMDEGKLVYVQKWDGKETALIREIKNDKLELKMTYGDITSTRIYKRA